MSRSARVHNLPYRRERFEIALSVVDVPHHTVQPNMASLGGGAVAITVDVCATRFPQWIRTWQASRRS